MASVCVQDKMWDTYSLACFFFLKVSVPCWSFRSYLEEHFLLRTFFRRGKVARAIYHINCSGFLKQERERDRQTILELLYSLLILLFVCLFLFLSQSPKPGNKLHKNATLTPRVGRASPSSPLHGGFTGGSQAPFPLLLAHSEDFALLLKKISSV